jgi:hypothetical protein
MSKQLENNQEKKTITLKNSKLLLLITLLIVLVILIPIGYALFSHTKTDEEETHIGDIEVVLHEDWPELGGTYETTDATTGDPVTETYTEYGISKKTKRIYGESIKELNSYVRVRLIPIVEYYVTDGTSTEGEWITAPVSQDKFVINVTGDSWTKSGDYWYYKNVLKGHINEEGPYDTDTMDISWQVAEIPSELGAYPIRTNVRVLLEYAQASNDMWKDLFRIDSLPNGVQTMEEFEAALGE